MGDANIRSNFRQKSAREAKAPRKEVERGGGGGGKGKRCVIWRMNALTAPPSQESGDICVAVALTNQKRLLSIVKEGERNQMNKSAEK